MIYVGVVCTDEMLEAHSVFSVITKKMLFDYWLNNP